MGARPCVFCYSILSRLRVQYSIFQPVTIDIVDIIITIEFEEVRLVDRFHCPVMLGKSYNATIRRQVKINGQRVELGEIEACLHGCDLVGSAVVVKESAESKRLLAFVAPPGKLQQLVRDTTSAEKAQKLQRLREALQEPSLQSGFSQHRFLQLQVESSNQLHWERKTSRSFGALGGDGSGLQLQLLRILAACGATYLPGGSPRTVSVQEVGDILAPLCWAQRSNKLGIC